MSHRVVGAFAISLTLSAAHARAQDDKQEGDAAKPATTDAAKAADEEEEEEEGAKPSSEAKAEVKAEIGTTESAQKATVEASATPAEAEANAGKAAERPIVYGKRGDWFIQPYGYARMDAIRDSTQSFDDGIQPNLVARAGTYRGSHGRFIFTARDSRVGFFVGAPEFHGLKSTAQIEFDFFGLAPTDARKHDVAVFGPVRMRHAYFKLETPILDVVAGQTFSVFGWNGHFYPATGAFLGVPGQVYHRDPQLRLEKTIAAGDAEFVVAAAAQRPGQRDSGIPDFTGGLKFAYKGWTGAAQQGAGRAQIAPISLGVSGIYRRFEVPAFRPENLVGLTDKKAQGYGFAVSALLPVIPAKVADDRDNALTFTGEFSLGTGIADMYTGMDGGHRMPLLPNIGPSIPAPVYPQNIDNGLVTFDRAEKVKTINWKAFVVGGQYYLPFANGRMFIAGIYSRAWSDNIKELTPAPNHGGIFTKMEYIDGTLGFDITPAITVAGSFQTVKQTFADVSQPDPIYGTTPPFNGAQGFPGQPGTGGEAQSARNNRAQLAMMMFF